MHTRLSDEQICTHLGDEYDRFHGAVVPPIYQNSLFVSDRFEDMVNAMSDEQGNYLYWRGNNPTREIAEQKIAALENGERCKLFASGMAAISSAILSAISQGDHVLCIGSIYGPTIKLLQYLRKFGIEYTVVPVEEVSNLENYIQADTKLIYMESPTTMTFRIFDIRAVTAFAKSKGIRTIMDNTWATPLFQKPLDMGVDIVVHSASKYLSGHSDLVGGALITNADLMKRLFYEEFQLLGGVMPPYEAWLLMRGLRTLPIRMQAHQKSALKLAEMLDSHPKIKRVNHPGLKSHPEFGLGQHQLRGYSGLFSFELKQNCFKSVASVINSLNMFKIGVSWGGFESLVISPNHGDNEEQLNRAGFDPGLIRVSVGLENTDELIADMNQALYTI